MELKEEIAGLTDEMLAGIGRLVRHNSVEGAAKPGMPFGEGPAAALAEGLQLASELGFAVTNLDNYCGYAEMGEGDEIIGIAGHLDIVPAGEGWKHDPFAATREGDYVYGRGTTDDKGPVVECLYAMKLLRDRGVPLGKRVRLIMGCNEETGSKCMAHYNEVAEPLALGFTPDANFPCIHGEKGHMAMSAESKHTRIISMEGGFVRNAVCDRCTTVIPAGDVSVSALRAALAAQPLTKWTLTENGDTLTVYAEGVAAHASTPLLGVNAAGCTMEALAAAGFADDFVDFYRSHIGTACDGSGVGLKCSDAYGELTFCNGLVRTENGRITCSIDIRVPVTYTAEQIRAMAEPYLQDEKGSMQILRIGAPLFYPADSALIRSLIDAYAGVTGDTEAKPLVIGGGTYAKALKNIVAFGPEVEGIDFRIHNTDEFLYIPNMLQATEIYYRAIENLLRV